MTSLVPCSRPGPRLERKAIRKIRYRYVRRRQGPVLVLVCHFLHGQHRSPCTNMASGMQGIPAESRHPASARACLLYEGQRERNTLARVRSCGKKYNNLDGGTLFFALNGKLTPATLETHKRSPHDMFDKSQGSRCVSR